LQMQQLAPDDLVGLQDRDDHAELWHGQFRR
jgi:hypothetical protein